MKELVINQNGKLVVTSRQVAESFEKRNSHVVEAIENKIKSLTAENPEVDISKLFIPTTFNHNGNEYKEYLLTRDGFTFIVMGFTGAKADSWKLRYIEAFNKIEETLKQNIPQLSKELQAIFLLDSKQQALESKINQLEKDLPLFNVECKELQAVVKKKGIEVLGGYRSRAYNDNSLRGKVYSDIQNQLRREFGVTRYEAIKRSQMMVAKEIIAKYTAPLFLQEEINSYNSQLKMEA